MERGEKGGGKVEGGGGERACFLKKFLDEAPKLYGNSKHPRPLAASGTHLFVCATQMPILFQPHKGFPKNLYRF